MIERPVPEDMPQVADWMVGPYLLAYLFWFACLQSL